MKPTRKPPLRRLESSPVFEPVKFDKSIIPQDDGTVVAVVTADDDETRFPCADMIAAQRLLSNFQPDYGEYNEYRIPWSVFYPGTP